jgi:hypothetical protein
VDRPIILVEPRRVGVVQHLERALDDREGVLAVEVGVTRENVGHVAFVAVERLVEQRPGVEAPPHEDGLLDAHAAQAEAHAADPELPVLVTLSHRLVEAAGALEDIAAHERRHGMQVRDQFAHGIPGRDLPDQLVDPRHLLLPVRVRNVAASGIALGVDRGGQIACEVRKQQVIGIEEREVPGLRARGAAVTGRREASVGLMDHRGPEGLAVVALAGRGAVVGAVVDHHHLDVGVLEGERGQGGLADVAAVVETGNDDADARLSHAPHSDLGVASEGIATGAGEFIGSPPPGLPRFFAG